MLAAFGFETMGVVVGDMFFVDPARSKARRPRSGESDWNCASSTATSRRGRSTRGSDLLQPPGVAGGPVRIHREPARDARPGPSPPRFDGWEPGRRHFVPELSADPVGWLAGQLADPAAVLTRAGVDPDEVSEADKAGLAAAAPEIVAAVKRMLDGVRDGELAPSPEEPVAAARTGWL